MNLERQNERDQRSEVLLRFFASAKNMNAFQGKTVEEIFRDEASIRETINNLTFEEFTQLLDGINGILRDKSKDDWKMDGKGVVLSSLILGENAPPHFKDKVNLLQKVLDAAKEMNRQSRSLEDIGILLGVGISEIHPYSEANGRTGRLLYTLLSWGMNKEKILEVLDVYGRDSVDFNIQMIESAVMPIIEYQVLKDEERNFTGLFFKTLTGLEFDPSIPESITKQFKNFLKRNLDSHALVISIYGWVKDNNKEEVFQTFPERVVITLERLTPLLSEGDLQNIQDRFWSFKKETAELLIDSIVNPTKPEYIKDAKYLKGPILEYIKNHILMHYAKYRVAGK